jgi:hypothetical protein
VTSAMTSVTTSCTTVYSEPVVCTAPGRQTYTLSPSKLPVMSPIKVTHISPIKFMSNGAGGTVALVAGNQVKFCTFLHARILNYSYLSISIHLLSSGLKVKSFSG